MNKIELFRQAVEKLQNNYADEEYMSDMNNWCVVHATKYMPHKNSDGLMFIQSTGMATNFDLPRATVHTTLNHVVKAHGLGSWDDMPIVILSPYKDIVKENGNPAEIAAVDTYWSTNPERGLVLPKSTFVIRPSNDVLFKIDEHGATYKRDNYTEEEVEAILKMLNDSDRATYEKYKNGDLKDYEVEEEFRFDERVKKMYDSAKDKKAFLRGLFEESRFDILSHFLRDAVIHMAMEKMHFHELVATSDGSEPVVAIYEAATAAGIKGATSNKGHSYSLYCQMDNLSECVYMYLKGESLTKKDGGIMNAATMGSLVDSISTPSGLPQIFVSEIKLSIMNNTPIDFMKLYETQFMEFVSAERVNAQFDLENATRRLEKEIPSWRFPDEARKNTEIEEAKKWQKRATDELKRLSKINTMADFDKNLSDSFRKHATRLSAEYNAWREKLTKKPDYDKLVEKLKHSFGYSNTMYQGRE